MHSALAAPALQLLRKHSFISSSVSSVSIHGRKGAKSDGGIGNGQVQEADLTLVFSGGLVPFTAAALKSKAHAA